MLKKILIGIAVFLVLTIGALVASTYIFKDDINDMLKAQINSELNATIDYSDYDLSILSSFPDFKFSLENFIVIGQGNFEGDTLARIKELALNLDAKKIILDKELQMHSLFVDELNLKAFVLADSSSSLNILKEQVSEETKIDTTEESLIDIAIESIVVKNSNIYYEEAPSNQIIVLKDINIDAEVSYIKDKADINIKSSIAGVYFASGESNQVIELEDLLVDAKADFLNQVLNLESNTQIAKTSFTSDNKKLLNKVKVKLDGILQADLEQKTYQLDQNISLNELNLGLKGAVANPTDAIEMDLSFISQQSSFKELLSLIPEQYLKDYKNLEVQGAFAMNGIAKGIFSDNSFPAFNIDMSVENGFFKYPELPTAIENINFKAQVKSPNSDMSNLDVMVPKASFSIQNEALDLSLNILDAKNDPFVDLKAQGKLDLAKIPNFYPIEGLKSLSGNLESDIAFKGKLSDIDKKKYENIDFQGDMKLVNMVYESDKTDLPVKVKTMNLDFTPRYANMTNLDMNYGQSDFKANGKLENLMNYVLADGTVKGNLNINSNKVNLSEIMGEEESTAEATSDSESESESIRVPKNIDFNTTANIKELDYDNLILKNVKGAVQIKNEALSMKSIQANMLGGDAKINGEYNTKKPGKPAIDFKYNVQNFDIKQCFEQLNTVQKIAPIAKFLDGKFNSTFAFNSFLQEDFTPDLSLLTGLGDVKISYANFKNFPLFKSVSDAVKVPILKNLDNANIKNAWTVFKVRDGKVDVEPFDYTYQDIKMNIQGSNGFDKTIDYVMKLTVPSDKFGGAASLANNWLSNQNIPLLNLSVPKDITFHLNLSGLISKPKVKILKVTTNGKDKGVVEQVTSGVVDKAKEEAEKLKKEAERKAREEAEKLKKQAEKKAKEEAEKLLQDALKDKLPNFGF